MGAALAIAFHRAGHHVFATARNPTKLAPLAEQGIETLALDITSSSSIAAAVTAVSLSLSTLPPQQQADPNTTANKQPPKGLNILINNAASSYSMPLSDASLLSARSIFETNVWGQLAVTQTFLPLLLKSTTHPDPESRTAMIVNHTSVGSKAALPFQGIYNASKAALAMLSETMRLELEGSFGIRVIDLKTAGVRTNIIDNNNVNRVKGGNAADLDSGNGKSDGNQSEGVLPMASIYEPAREIVEQAMSQDGLRGRGISAEEWADEVVPLLLGKNPPGVIWKGENALLARIAVAVPCNLGEGPIKKMTRLDEVERILKGVQAR